MKIGSRNWMHVNSHSPITGSRRLMSPVAVCANHQQMYGDNQTRILVICMIFSKLRLRARQSYNRNWGYCVKMCMVWQERIVKGAVRILKNAEILSFLKKVARQQTNFIRMTSTEMRGLMTILTNWRMNRLILLPLLSGTRTKAINHSKQLILMSITRVLPINPRVRCAIGNPPREHLVIDNSISHNRTLIFINLKNKRLIALANQSPSEDTVGEKVIEARALIQVTNPQYDLQREFSKTLITSPQWPITKNFEKYMASCLHTLTTSIRPVSSQTTAKV